MKNKLFRTNPAFITIILNGTPNEITIIYDTYSKFESPNDKYITVYRFKVSACDNLDHITSCLL